MENVNDFGFYDHIGFDMFGNRIHVQIPAFVHHETPEADPQQVMGEKRDDGPFPPEKIESNGALEAIGRYAYTRTRRIFRRQGECEEALQIFIRDGWEGWQGPEHAKMKVEIAKQIRRLKLYNQPKAHCVRQLEFPDVEQDKVRQQLLRKRAKAIIRKVKRRLLIKRLKEERLELKKKRVRKILEKRKIRFDKKMERIVERDSKRYKSN